MTASATSVPVRVGRYRQLLELVTRSPRLLVWWPSAAAGGAVLVMLVWQSGSAVAPPERTLLMVRLGLLAVVVGSLSLLDDASRTSTLAVPLCLRWRLGVRVGAMLTVVVPPAGLLLAALPPELRPVRSGLAIELAGVLALGLATSLFMQTRRGVDEPSPYASLVLLLLPVVALVLQPVLSRRWQLLVEPGPEWDAAHLRWLVVLGLALLAVVRLSRDP